MSQRSLHFDGMTWPDPASEPYRTLAWRLRYDASSITETECLYLASCLDAFGVFLRLPGKRQRQIITGMRVARQGVPDVHAS